MMVVCPEWLYNLKYTNDSTGQTWTANPGIQRAMMFEQFDYKSQFIMINRATCGDTVLIHFYTTNHHKRQLEI